MAGALQYLESQRNAQPDLAEWYSSLADLYQGKLWHQLTLKLEQFVALAVVQSKGSRETFQSRPSEDRTIPLSVVAKQTRLSIEDVEYLLMKSLSVHLIEGMIDQVEGTVHVSWVQPRVLGISQIKSLCGRLDTWAGKVHAALLSVEAEIPDLVAS